jgi:hypothetical protein
MELLIAAAIGAIILYFIAASRKAYKEREVLKYMRKFYRPPSPRSQLKKLIESRGIDVVDGGSDQLSHEAIALAQYISAEALKRSGKSIKSAYEDEAFLAMLICMVATDYLSQQLELQFETLSSAACIPLCRNIRTDTATELFKEVISEHNRMAQDKDDSQITLSIGSHVADFFNKNVDESLDKLSGLFNLLYGAVARA